VIARTALQNRIQIALERSRIITIRGPRQCGKTTLDREFLPSAAPGYFDLENPRDLQRLDEPMSALENLEGIVVIDEIQRRSDLLPILRALADRTPLPARFIILGSASPAFIRQSSESLAGRIEHVFMHGFALGEIGFKSHMQHLLRGGFPLSFLARISIFNSSKLIEKALFSRIIFQQFSEILPVIISPYLRRIKNQSKGSKISRIATPAGVVAGRGGGAVFQGISGSSTSVR
jgi:predicted AAA+ superfamily ATPase